MWSETGFDVTASWSDIPSITSTLVTSELLFEMNKSSMFAEFSVDRVGSITIYCRNLLLALFET